MVLSLEAAAPPQTRTTRNPTSPPYGSTPPGFKDPAETAHIWCSACKTATSQHLRADRLFGLRPQTSGCDWEKTTGTEATLESK